MSEHVYEDLNYTEEVKRRKQLATDLNPYVNSEDVRVSNTNTERENHSTTRNLQPQHPGFNTTGGRCYRVTAVCLLLLCIFLLTPIAVLWIKFNTLNTEKDQLQTSYNNLTLERDQLQTSYHNLTLERDQLQTRYSNLTLERDQLQTSYNNLTIERNQCLVTQGWRLFNNLYYISTEQKSWTESRQDCRDRGADLVIINSAEEEQFIEKMMGNYTQVWIGMSDRDIEGNWKWVDGTDVTSGTVFWHSGEPNNQYNDEDCGDIHTLAQKKAWNYMPCSFNLYWICEKKAFL